MSRRARLRLGSGLLWLACVLALPLSSEAQTTVVLSAPDNQVVDAAVRGGSWGNTNFDGQALFTRASSDAEYARRALLKFDTENTIPAGATIRSATLTLTISFSNALTRTLRAYRIGSSWDEDATTWWVRRSGQPWSSAGGDLAGIYASASAGTSVGSKVTFDVTTLVQETVSGAFGSRYTRVALVDDGDSSSGSYKEFYPSETGDSAARPRLTVTYGASTTSTGSSSSPSTVSSSPSPAPVPATTASLLLSLSSRLEISGRKTREGRTRPWINQALSLSSVAPVILASIWHSTMPMQAIRLL